MSFRGVIWLGMPASMCVFVHMCVHECVHACILHCGFLVLFFPSVGMEFFPIVFVLFYGHLFSAWSSL